MKFVLFLTAVTVSWVLIESAKRRTRNSNCLVHNKYMHERTCKGPRRAFYTFHRVIFDCIQVTTKCRKIYKRNEYKTLDMCRDDCHFHMSFPYAPPIGKQTTAAAGEGETTAAAGEEGAEGAEPAEEPAAARTLRKKEKPNLLKNHQRSKRRKQST